MDIKPTFRGYIKDEKDALLIFQAIVENKLKHVPRRPYEIERPYLIVSGNIFVFIEEISGIKRWTDGINWSPSRISGKFLLYKELDRTFPNYSLYSKSAIPRINVPSITNTNCTNPSSGSSSSSNNTSNADISGHQKNDSTDNNVDMNPKISFPYPNLQVKYTGFIKKTISLKYKNPSSISAPIQNLHIVSYYLEDDINFSRLPTPSESLFFANISASKELVEALENSNLGNGRSSSTRNANPPFFKSSNNDKKTTSMISNETILPPRNPVRPINNSTNTLSQTFNYQTNFMQHPPQYHQPIIANSTNTYEYQYPSFTTHSSTSITGSQNFPLTYIQPQQPNHTIISPASNYQVDYRTSLQNNTQHSTSSNNNISTNTYLPTLSVGSNPNGDNLVNNSNHPMLSNKPLHPNYISPNNHIPHSQSTSLQSKMITQPMNMPYYGQNPVISSTFLYNSNNNNSSNISSTSTTASAVHLPSIMSNQNYSDGTNNLPVFSNHSSRPSSILLTQSAPSTPHSMPQQYQKPFALKQPISQLTQRNSALSASNTSTETNNGGNDKPANFFSLDKNNNGDKNKQ
ncbi:hypothetical protein KAFR_0K01100 [Kazachstania africana CBS 2517]|uniref:Uncharacterized protein n=1 Tax=Kazachstania africana (strain ATCC 22294 / BCRC 22015 / CBS 2517 / CECT 1963 / NBRC 1671 / NRRL Y-8276) TaxID=1071382 RepID=H2B1G5_KAZAF|nr:hypothetical protein KAFR_0K01100 [Kazachstania africana CBS 2517]CCF60465.1 hypothetical protein KAFR_0K01100 [Kazachstania africana CBS 2517]